MVGTKVAPPFVIKQDDGSFTGISIELWQRAAEEMGLTYEFREMDLQDLISGLQDGTLDVSVAALTVNASREAVVDFSHPFHTTGLAIAVPLEGSALVATMKRLISWEFLAVLAALTGLLLLVGFLLWLAERHKNKDMFGGKPAEGIGASFWWAAVTMTTVGYGDKAPITLAGRIIGLVWMFAGIIIISSFTAAIATSLTVSQLETRVQGADDLPDVRVATLIGSTSADYLERQGIRFRPQTDLTAAVEGLAQARFEAVVYDKPILQYMANQEYPRRTQVLPETLERQDYAIALPEGSNLRESLNQQLLKIIESETWRLVLAGYLGDER